MSYDVVVVGGGIGGLTVAALLSARGVKTCLLERQSQVGGCIGRIEFSGYDFEPGMGLYTSWGPGGIYERVFSELPVETPGATRIESDYVVRLGRSDIRLKRNEREFFDQLRDVFPECQQQAVEFYELVNRVNEASSQQIASQKGGGVLGKALGRFRSPPQADNLLQDARSRTALSFSTATSARFQRFIDAQLRAFLQTDIARCAFLPACLALSLPLSDQYSISGGTARLAEHLEEAIKSAGGVVRLNSAVLRLAYNKRGDAIGVDLLSGETVLAKRAIISNLTIWDTYGRLVGLNRTPAAMKNRLLKIQSSGAYVIYAAVDDSAVARLPARNFLVASDESGLDERLSGEFTVSIGQATETSKCPATIKTGTEVGPWFSFQTTEEEYEKRDQTALERFWEKLHGSVPELGAAIEVIETANPRTYYDLTRRKLGMVMGIEWAFDAPPGLTEHTTSISNLFVVGDTVAPALGISSVVNSARLLANQIQTPK